MPDFDRRNGGLVRLLAQTYPQLASMDSEQIEAFLNADTGCSVTPEMDNGAAFDLWRPVLAHKHGRKELWPYTSHDIQRMKARAAEMKADEERRQAALQKESPDKPG